MFDFKYIWSQSVDLIRSLKRNNLKLIVPKAIKFILSEPFRHLEDFFSEVYLVDGRGGRVYFAHTFDSYLSQPSLNAFHPFQKSRICLENPSCASMWPIIQAYSWTGWHKLRRHVNSHVRPRLASQLCEVKAGEVSQIM